jgi:hypothetical protein
LDEATLLVLDVAALSFFYFLGFLVIISSKLLSYVLFLSLSRSNRVEVSGPPIMVFSIDALVSNSLFENLEASFV